MMQQGSHSYCCWAFCLSQLINGTVSKQGIWSRVNNAFITLLKELVGCAIVQAAQRSYLPSIYASFARVWVEDSTCIGLPDYMGKIWKGNYSRGKDKSVVKVHVIMNVLNGFFAHCSLEPFTVTEQALSRQIVSIARTGDLIIRDLGYFVLEVFEQLSNNAIYFLSRKRYGIKLFDVCTGNPVTISQLAKGKNYIDCHVYIGAGQQCEVRLIAVLLSEKQKQARIRKAKKDRDKRMNHSKQYYRELGYAIFITNVENDIWTVEQAVKAYRVRWNIEILFKCWKSRFNIKRMIPHNSSRVQTVEAVIYLMLLFIAWFQF